MRSAGCHTSAAGRLANAALQAFCQAPCPADRLAAKRSITLPTPRGRPGPGNPRRRHRSPALRPRRKGNRRRRVVASLARENAAGIRAQRGQLALALDRMRVDRTMAQIPEMREGRPAESPAKLAQPQAGAPPDLNTPPPDRPWRRDRCSPSPVMWNDQNAPVGSAFEPRRGPRFVDHRPATLAMSPSAWATLIGGPYSTGSGVR